VSLDIRRVLAANKTNLILLVIFGKGLNFEGVLRERIRRQPEEWSSAHPDGSYVIPIATEEKTEKGAE
jgi:hypothetical protein